MTLMIELPPELENRLKSEAELHGIDAPEYAKKLIEAGLPTDVEQQRRLNQSTLDLFARWDSEDATDDPQEIARRDRAFEELKNAMNQNRLDSEGPDARIPFP